MCRFGRRVEVRDSELNSQSPLANSKRAIKDILRQWQMRIRAENSKLLVRTALSEVDPSNRLVANTLNVGRNLASSADLKKQRGIHERSAGL